MPKRIAPSEVQAQALAGHVRAWPCTSRLPRAVNHHGDMEKWSNTLGATGIWHTTEGRETTPASGSAMSRPLPVEDHAALSRPGAPRRPPAALGGTPHRPPSRPPTAPAAP